MHSLQLNQSFAFLSKRKIQGCNNTGREFSHVNICRSMQRRKVVMQSKIEEVNKKSAGKGVCVVVGGGPAGLGTAIMLAQRGWENITVLEKLSEQQVTDPTKSYQYALHGRGQQFLEKIDANEEIKRTGLFFSETTGISQVRPDGEIQQIGSLKEFTSINFPAYLCLRSTVLEVLSAIIKKQYQDVIQISFNTICIDLKKDFSGIKLTYQKNGQNSLEMWPQLIFGCDGQNSFIRQKLQEISKNKEFHLNQINLPSSGKRYKILQVPSSFKFYKNSQQTAQNDTLTYYFIYGKSTDEKHKLVLHLLPPSKSLQQKNMLLLTVATHQNGHILWSLDTSEKLFNYLEKEFPQLNFREMLSSEQAERFAKSKGGTFPMGAYCSNAAYTCDNFDANPPTTPNPTPQGVDDNNNNNNNLQQGVVLIGDSLHHFPPDQGQGVNSAFEVILVF
eukprot:TRINITY_DN2704_c0_g1_i13.p1 TRINITY_DN2704_c0_g1~~TRINITY_DN2704_c0_g1_i13.p1  ORF type:complete len:446 (-),score=40.42 TRINITY_DN2704_c0_g1_i13:990-2327(-)